MAVPKEGYPNKDVITDAPIGSLQYRVWSNARNVSNIKCLTGYVALAAFIKARMY